MGKSAAELFGVFEIPDRGRGRLVATAVELFYRHGFNAVGLDRVIEEAGVTKTTFYKHFQGKSDLMVAAVEMRDAWELGAWRRAPSSQAETTRAGSSSRSSTCSTSGSTTTTSGAACS